MLGPDFLSQISAGVLATPLDLSACPFPTVQGPRALAQSRGLMQLLCLFNKRLGLLSVRV